MFGGCRRIVEQCAELSLNEVTHVGRTCAQKTALTQLEKPVQLAGHNTELGGLEADRVLTGVRHL